MAPRRAVRVLDLEQHRWWRRVRRRSGNGELVASVTLSWEDPLVWGHQKVPAGYVHRLMVARTHAGSGVGRSLLAWAEDRVKKAGRSLVRLDCARTNQRLRRYYEAAGYRAVGFNDFDHIAVEVLAGVRPIGVALYEKAL